VGEGAHAQITTTSATRIYRNRVDMPPSYQLNEITVAENGLLELLPDPLIPFAQSAYQQRTAIRLAEGAGLFWWETVTPGREARDECFDYDLLGLEVDIQAKGSTNCVGICAPGAEAASAVIGGAFGCLSLFLDVLYLPRRIASCPMDSFRGRTRSVGRSIVPCRRNLMGR